MPDLDLPALRKVAEQYVAETGDSGPLMWERAWEFRSAFMPATVLALLEELETLRAQVSNA